MSWWNSRSGRRGGARPTGVAGGAGTGGGGTGERGSGGRGDGAPPPPWVVPPGEFPTSEAGPVETKIGVKPVNGDGGALGFVTVGRSGSTRAGTLRSCVPGR